jgi:hypothetical protein
MLLIYNVSTVERNTALFPCLRDVLVVELNASHLMSWLIMTFRESSGMAVSVNDEEIIVMQEALSKKGMFYE